MNILTEIEPIIPNINNAKFQHERFWRERVIALVLQSNWYSSFPFNPSSIKLKWWWWENVTSTIERVENAKFTYDPLDISQIVNKISTLRPASHCYKVWETRIANCISAIWCWETGTLFKLFDILSRTNESHHSRQEVFVKSRNLWKKSKTTFEDKLQERWIDPNISRAEIEYFRSKLPTETTPKSTE